MPLGLVEIVEVALTFSPFPHIVDDGSRNAAVGIVEIAFHTPIPVVENAMQVAFQPFGMDVAILPDGCGVPCSGAVHIDTTVSELVMTAGIEKTGTDRGTQVVAELMLI